MDQECMCYESGIMINPFCAPELTSTQNKTKTSVVFVSNWAETIAKTFWPA